MRPRRHGGEVADSRKNIVRHYHGWGSRGINLSARNDSPKSGGRRKRGADGGGGVVRMGRALVRASGKSHLDPFEPTWRGHARDQDSRARKKNVVVTMMGLVKGEQSAAFCHRPLGARAADGGAQQARPLGAARRPRLCSTTGSIRARAFSSSDDPTGTATAWR